MMRPKHVFALLSALTLLLSSCSEDTGGEPALSASVTEDTPTVTEEQTSSPADTEKITETETDPYTEEVTTAYEPEIAELPADTILKISEALSTLCRSYTRTSRTKTEIDILGEKTETETESVMQVNGTNAVFRRSGNNGEEEYFLIDGFLCYTADLGKYRIGGHDISSFTEIFGSSFPLSEFENGRKERDGGDILLFFDRITPEGEAALKSMLNPGGTLDMTVTRSELTVRTDTSGNMKENSFALELTVASRGTTLMTVSLASFTEQSATEENISLGLPALSSYTSFPDRSTAELYESAMKDISSFVTSYQAFEFTEKDESSVSSDTVKIDLSSETDYAYASRIGASIERTFDVADGTGKHTVLTHFDYQHGFSQIDGGSIFVDSTLNAENLFLTLSRPFETSLYPLSGCTGVESVKNGRITFTLNDDAIKNISQTLLLQAGIYDTDPKTVKADTASTYILLDSSGKVASIGYDFSASVTSGGITYTLSRNISLEITSRGSAKVKVISIDVEEDEE